MIPFVPRYRWASPAELRDAIVQSMSPSELAAYQEARRVPAVVIAAILERDGRFLIARRPFHKHHGGLWEFPGGKIQPGETLGAAAARELAEEFRLSVTSVGEIISDVYDESSGLTIRFVRVVASGEPECLEHAELVWISRPELASYDLAPADRAFADQLAGLET